MIRRRGKRETWQTAGPMVRLDRATPARRSMRRFLTCNAERNESLRIPQKVHLTQNSQNVHPVLKGIVLELTLRGAAYCALGCRCPSLVSACRVQSCREKLRSKSPWIAR